MKPFFSILIPAYNHTQFLAAAIQSVLDNEFQDLEILVSDDCSPRGIEIAAIVQGYSKDPRVKFYSQPRNLGWSDNRNFLVNAAAGQYVMLMGDDDILPPNCLGTIHQTIREHPEHHIYAPGYAVIDETGRRLALRCAPSFLQIGPQNPAAMNILCFADWLPFWVFHPFTYFYRADIKKDITYSKNFHIGDDILFLIEVMCKNMSILVIPEALFHWRKPGSACKRSLWARFRCGVKSIAGNIISKAGEVSVNKSGSSKYISLSSEFASSLLARAKIVRFLQQSDAWGSHLKQLFRSEYYLLRFVLWHLAIVLRDERKAKDMRELGLRDKDIQWMLSEYDSRKPLFPAQRLKWDQLTEYQRLFGVRSLLGLAGRFLHLGC